MGTQYDLNIWNEGEYNGEEDRWRISVHELEYATDGHVQCGDHREDLTLNLTDEEVAQLTLGWGKDLGGDYTSDSDFFLDSDSFFDIYRDIPERVSNFIKALPPYTMKDWRN